MFAQVDSGSATNSLNSICRNWEETSFAAGLTESEEETLRDVAAVKGWMTTDEWEDEEIFSECDCALWLHSQGTISRTKARQYYDADFCHERANEEADNAGIA